MNIQINNFNQGLIELINEYAEYLPAGTIYFILLNAIKEIENIYKQSIQNEENQSDQMDEDMEYDDKINFSVPIDEIPKTIEKE